MVHDDTWVIIPVYNEVAVIAQVVADLRTTFRNIVCVDDGSTDGSAAQIATTAAHLVQHPINLGQGAALQTGLCYALARPGGRFFVTFDADGQHRVTDAACMVDAARDGLADVVLGSRFLDQPDSRQRHVPMFKRIALRLVVSLSPTTRKLHLTDAHNGLRVFNRAAAGQLRISMNGMAHASEIISRLARSSWTVRELPVTIRYTEYSMSKGQSLINGINILFDLSVRSQR
ncbi:MAG TPA: glycosyltransferase family 2 protein [Pseudonocardiaceae bacterium]|nr:glycosyltransferase family 2 protein [Pseudonocardiaceae bacterium]